MAAQFPGDSREAGNGFLVHLIGFAGCGKYSIASEIGRHLDCVLVDNHTVNNPILGVVGADGKTPLSSGIWDLVGQVRSAILEAIRLHSPAGSSFVLTNELWDGQAAHMQHFERVREIANHRRMVFLPVRLLVDPSELARRVASADRKARLKDCSVESALAKRRDDVFVPNIPYLELDVSFLSCAAAAQTIIKALNSAALAWRGQRASGGSLIVSD